MTQPLGALLRVSFLAPLFALAILIAGARPAEAVTFCVNKSPCAGTAKATIQAALTEASGNGSIDTILVGANGGAPYVETLTYSNVETVNLVGDGVGQTIVQGPGSFQNAVTLLSPTSTIQHMTIRAPDVTDGAALRWDGAALDIEAVHLGPSSTETVGMVAENGALLNQSKVDVNGFGLFRLANSASATIRNSSLVGDGAGIDAANANLILERSTVTGKRSAVVAGGSGTLTVYNAVLKLTGAQFGDAAITALSGAEAQIRHATLVGAGGSAGVFTDASSNSTTVTIFDSIIEDFEFAIRCFGENGHETAFGVSYSNWIDPVQENGGCNKTVGAGNTTIEPQFVNKVFRDFRLKAPSPLIDAADPGSPFKVDRLNLPRPVDGDGVGGPRSDMGAYEYQRQAPKASIQAPTTAAIGEAVAFSASGSSDPDAGDLLGYAWDFGDGGNAAGFAPEHAFAAGGDYTVKLTVTDPTGLAATATAQVQVPAAPAGGTPGGGGEPAGGTPAAAQLSDLRAVPKRISRGKGKPKLLRGAGKGIRFRLSAPANVRLTLARCAGKTGCAKKRAVSGSRSFDAPAGTSTIRFRGRLTGKLLPPGRYLAKLSIAGHEAKTVRFTLL